MLTKLLHNFVKQGEVGHIDRTLLWGGVAITVNVNHMILCLWVFCIMGVISGGKCKVYFSGGNYVIVTFCIYGYHVLNRKTISYSVIDVSIYHIS